MVVATSRDAIGVSPFPPVMSDEGALQVGAQEALEERDVDHGREAAV